jgi:hypothetical protein
MIDGERHSASKMELEVKGRQMQIIPGGFLELSDSPANTSKIFKINPLPEFEATQELSRNTLLLIRHATTEEFKDLSRFSGKMPALKTHILS